MHTLGLKIKVLANISQEEADREGRSDKIRIRKKKKKKIQGQRHETESRAISDVTFWLGRASKLNKLKREVSKVGRTEVTLHELIALLCSGDNQLEDGEDQRPSPSPSHR